MMTNSQKSECNSNEKGVTTNSSLQSKLRKKWAGVLVSNSGNLTFIHKLTFSNAATG